MENKNNPVSRLRENLLIFKDGARKDSPVSHQWAKVFECQTSDTVKIFGGIALMSCLNSEAREATQTFSPGSPDFFFKPFAQVEQLLSIMAMHTQWASVSPLLSPETMTALEFIEHLIEPNYSKSLPNYSDKIVDLLAQIDALVESCITSHLDAELKRIFVKQLQVLRSSLLSYRISGPSGVEDAIQQVTGAMVLSKLSSQTSLKQMTPFLSTSSTSLVKSTN